MVRKARKNGAKGQPGDIVLFAGRSKKTNKAGNSTITTTFVADCPTINLDASAFVDVVTHALLVHFRETILSGTKPDGSGAQVPLSQAAREESGRLTKYRGAKSGHMADALYRTEITGSTVKAKARILPPRDRNPFVSKEAGKGIFYTRLGGEADEVIRLAVEARIKAALEGTARPAERGPVTGEGADK